MSDVIYHGPIYKFLFYIKHFGKDLNKKILDCGAGGNTPPLGLFYERGFETHGIDISEEQIKLAEKFSQENKMELNIIKGDIRDIPFENESFEFVLSYNTIFHLTKKDIKKSIDEAKRVLKKNGLFFVNFMTPEDKYFGEGKQISKGEFELVNDEGVKRYRAFFELEEVKEYFDGFEILLLENRHIRLPTLWKDYEASYIDIIVKKR
ncbi:MAG: class I SAM-dependent methyltransferase [Asgard group archaeon]|nr:class I SAM-dependent methyltransferase [Asgard group archaeon]